MADNIYDLINGFNESKGFREHEETKNDLNKTLVIGNFVWRKEEEGIDADPLTMHKEMEKIGNYILHNKYAFNFLDLYRQVVLNGEWDRILMEESEKKHSKKRK